MQETGTRITDIILMGSSEPLWEGRVADRCSRESGRHLATQDLLAEPEERRSFMDMRLLLVRGDIGEAKSVPSPCAVAAAGVSPG